MSKQVIAQEVQIDFDDINEAVAMELYVKSELVLDCIINENPLMLCVYDVPENKLSAIRRRCAVKNISKGTVKVINYARDTIISTAEFAAYQVAAPVAQAGIKAGVGIAKVAVKSTLSTGATLVGSVVENTRTTANELKIDPEVIRAKQELKGAYTAVKSLFGFKGSSAKQVRVIPDTAAQPALLQA